MSRATAAALDALAESPDNDEAVLNCIKKKRAVLAGQQALLNGAFTTAQASNANSDFGMSTCDFQML